MCDLLYRRKAARMMVRSGATLMSRSGGNDGETKLVLEVEGKNGKEWSFGIFRETNRLRR